MNKKEKRIARTGWLYDCSLLSKRKSKNLAIKRVRRSYQKEIKETIING